MDITLSAIEQIAELQQQLNAVRSERDYFKTYSEKLAMLEREFVAALNEDAD